MKNGLSCLGGIVFVIAIIAVGSVTNGIALLQMWRWFIAPAFGVSYLTLPLAIGLSLTVSFLTYQKVDERKGKSLEDSISDLLILLFARPLAIVVIGWVVFQFVEVGS